MDTTNLDDLLNQAEAQEAEQGEWIKDINYITKNFYVDEHGVVEIKDKTIGDMSKHISVKGESYSQYIEFKIGRFFDGIDLTKMQLAIYFNIPNVGEDENRPINVYYNENEIKFGWVIPPEISQVNLTIDFCIYARGILSDGNNYILKTKTAKYSINDGLEIGNGIIEPTNNWYLNFVLQMDEKVSQASESADRAVKAASSVDGVVETVTTARDEVVNKASTVDTQHSEVESWHQESEQFRNEAEQFRNQAEAITGIGLAEEGKPGIVQPDGVTTKVDENGKLIVIGGGSGGGGTTDYKALENKPSIAGIELNGDKSYDELGLASKEAVARNFQTVNQNIQELDDYTQSLGEDISAFDAELEQTNQQLQYTTDKVDNLTERTESGFKVEVVGKDIHVTDAVDGKVVDFAMYGKSEQNTTSGKNLLKSSLNSGISNGITYTVNENKSVTLNGTASATVYLYPLLATDSLYLSNAIMNKDCIISHNADLPSGVTLNINRVDDDSSRVTATKEGKLFKYTRTVEQNTFVDIAIVQGTVINNVTLYPMIRLASIEDDTYEPYTGGIPSPNPDYPQEIETTGASGSIEVKSCGKNLLKNTASTQTIDNVTFTVNEDGVVNVNGQTSSVAVSLQPLCDIELVEGSKYILSGGASSNVRLYIYYQEDWTKLNVYSTGNDILFTAPITGIYRVYIRVLENTTITNALIKPMLRLPSDTDSTYEPYKETKSIIPTPNGLIGIKVNSGGNYTDENGQQWITDEIIRYADGSGEYVQRIYKEVLNGSENWSLNTVNSYGIYNFNTKPQKVIAIAQMSSHFVYDRRTIAVIDAPSFNITYANIFLRMDSSVVSDVNSLKAWLSENNVTVCYELAEPITTPLTAEQLAEIEKLSTFSPVTNISNDADCGMSVTYATLQEALMLQEAYNQSKANAEEIANVKEEIVDIKKELSDTTFKVDTIITKADLGIKETASGEEIHLTDSAEGKAVEYALYGKAKQNTTSGKNILNPNYCHAGGTNNGVTMVNNNDNTFTFTGSKTDSSIIVSFPISHSKDSLGFLFKKAGKYTLSLSGDGYNKTLNQYFFVNLFYGGTSYNNVMISKSKVTVEITEEILAYDDLKTTYGFYASTSDEIYNGTLKVQIEYGEVATSFEPYTNGPSPNPDYPQDIEIAGESYNLLENTATSQTIKGVEFVVDEDGVVTANGTSTGDIVFPLIGWEEVKEKLSKYIGEKLIGSGSIGGSLSTYYINFQGLNKDGIGIQSINGDSPVIDVVDFTNFNTVQVYIGIRSGVTVNNIVFKPMLRKASVKNTRYMPYGKGSVEVKSIGKNLIPYPYGRESGFASSGITYTYDEKGVITANGISNNTSFFLLANNTLKEDFPKLVGKTTLSLKSNSGLFSVYIKYEDKNGNTIKEYAVRNKNGSITFDAYDGEYHQIEIGLYLPVNTSVPSDKIYVQLESGEASTEYKPYKETLSTIPTENGLAGIPVSSGGNYTDQNGQQWICDEIVKYADGSGAYIQRVGKAVFDGSEDWNYTTGNDKELLFTRSLNGLGKKGQSEVEFLCSHFVSYAGGTHWADYKGTFPVVLNTYALDTQFSILAKLGAYGSVNTFKEWLVSNPIEVLYELAEPITTPLTAEEIAEISTFYPVTNISNDFVCGMRIDYVGEGIITTNTEIPVVAQDGELESGDNIVTLFGKIANKLKSLAGSDVQQQLTDIVARLDALERNQKTIIYSDTEPETVEENTIVMVYEAEE